VALTVTVTITVTDHGRLEIEGREGGEEGAERHRWVVVESDF